LQNNGQYAGAIIASIILGFARHALARLRNEVRLANAPRNGASKNAVNGDGASTALLAAGQAPTSKSRFTVPFLQQSYLSLRILDMILFGIVATIGFFNMLIVMTYNPGLFVAIVAGEMLGVLFMEPPSVAGTFGLPSNDETGHSCH
jgi:hypothetical protein